MTKFWPVKHKRNTSEDYKKALLFLIKKKKVHPMPPSEREQKCDKCC